jgi:DNA modification methylase
MDKIIWHNEKRKIKDLIKTENNPRVLTDKQYSDLKKSLSKFDLAEIPAINIDNKILAGHQRLKVLSEIKGDDYEIDVRVPNRKLNKKESEEYLIRSNKNTGEWDFDILANEFEMEDLKDWGFEDFEFGLAVEDEQEVIEDEVPEVQDKSIVKKGDIWILGNHKLVCGDSTNIDDVKKLIGDEKADMICSDPPYGMKLDTDWSQIGGCKYPKVIGDEKEFDITFFLEYFKEVKEQFWWGADYYIRSLPYEVGSWLVWDKRSEEGFESSGNPDAMIGSMFELCWSKNKHRREIIRFRWAGSYGLWQDDTKGRVHPTQKPASMIIKILIKYGKKDDIVLDLFGGSGSTLIACEQLNRQCRMMEIDEKYCDVIIRRWQNLTGKDAILKSNNNKFNELKR